MNANIPDSKLPRLVIIGGGFGGLKLAQKIDDKKFQTVLIDKNNYHQFPPLIYQVASSGLEPSSIAFPFRSVLRRRKNFYFRLAALEAVDTENKTIRTNIGELKYDYLVLACGGTTNYFGNKHIARYALPMKSLYESMNLRNVLLQNIEKSLFTTKPEERDALLNIVIVGGGPSGVEIAGALAEMKNYVIPKDYPDLDIRHFHIHLIDASPRLLLAMSPQSSEAAKNGLKSLGVELHQNTLVTDYDGETITFKDNTTLRSKTVIWVSGIIANAVEGVPSDAIGHARRILVDEYNAIKGIRDVYVIGDQSLLTDDPKYPHGHPQLAQVALQQASQLAVNLKRIEEKKALHPFRYKDLGSMATIGRNRAVAEIGKIKWSGFLAWVLWLVVHLRSILSVRNKVVVLFNWMWNYVTYDRSLRLILKRNIPTEPHENNTNK